MERLLRPDGRVARLGLVVAVLSLASCGGGGGGGTTRHRGPQRIGQSDHRLAAG